MAAEGADERDDFDSWNTRYGDRYPVGTRLDREFRTSRLLVFAARSWIYRIDTILRQETGQSRVRWQVLFTLAFAPQPATMSDVGHRCRVKWPTLLRVVQEMERDGLIAREDNPDDKRSRLLRLTPAGEDVLNRLQPTLDEERAELLSGLSDKELAACEGMLQSIFEAAIRPRRPARTR